MWRARLGLAAEDHRLVEADPQPALHALQADSTFTAAWKNYVKLVLKKGYWFAFADKPSVLFLVLDNKTLPGREERAAGEATGRKLVLSFYELASGDPDLAVPTHRATGALEFSLLTLAELLQTCQLGNLPLDPERTSADTELLLEAEFLNLDLTRYEGTAEPSAAPHAAHLGQGSHAEDAHCAETRLEDLTKMALARHLARSGALGQRETLRSAWSLTGTALRNRAAPLLPQPLPAPQPPQPAPQAAPAGGRGGGGGRGARGRGRGRG